MQSNLYCYTPKIYSPLLRDDRINGEEMFDKTEIMKAEIKDIIVTMWTVSANKYYFHFQRSTMVQAVITINDTSGDNNIYTASTSSMTR